MRNIEGFRHPIEPATEEVVGDMIHLPYRPSRLNALRSHIFNFAVAFVNISFIQGQSLTSIIKLNSKCKEGYQR